MPNTTIAFKEQKKRRSWLRILGWLVVAVIVLVVAAYFVATSPAFIKGVILPRVGNELHANITVSDISFSPFKQIVLHDLKVQAKGQAPILTMSEATVRYHLWDILGGDLHVDEIALNSPTIELVKNPDGSSNLDPLLKALQGKPTRAAPAKPKPSKASKASQINLGKLTLRNASIVEIKNFGGGRSNVLALTNFDLTLSNVRNGQSAALQLSAALQVGENPPGGTNGFLAAAIQGNFKFALTPDLKPASASGKAQLAVSRAGGAFGDFSALGAGLNCDATSTDIKQLDLHFENAGAPLGELAVSGPLNLAKMAGRLQVVLRGVDRRLLNLAGAAHGMDFDSTTISSTNEIVLTNSGKTIAATGRFLADKFQVTRAGQTTPALDFSADYAVTVNNAAQTVQLRQLTLTGLRSEATARQAGAESGRRLLAAHLSQPMSVAWGNNAASVGSSTFDLEVTNLNLADWRAFLGNTASAGKANLQMKLSSQQGGKQLGVDLNSQINDLAAEMGSNRTFRATVALSAQGQAENFKQFNLSDYQLQIIRQNQPLLTVSGSATYNLADASAEAQVALEASLAGLDETLSQPNAKISSGTIKLNGHVTQKKGTQTVTGRMALADFTGQFGKNSFSDFGSTIDMEVNRTPERIQIQKVSGTLGQKGNTGGTFTLTGAFEPASKTAQLNADLSDFNQAGLRPFLQPLLAGKQLVSIAVNGKASVQYAPNSSSALKADLQVTNLVVHDPKGQFPAAPLAAQLRIDTTLQKQSVNIHRFQIGLTPTGRAQNQIELEGDVDFSRPKAIQGDLKLSSAGLDLTRYYDLFAGGAKKTVHAVPAASSAAPASTPANQEPPAVNLPLKNFTVAADIGRLYLHEVAITNFQTTVKIDGGHVMVKPLQLALNGAPVSATVNLDLSVPGYKYDFGLGADQIPLSPLVNSFMPDRQGEMGGTLTAHAQIAGAGTTGANLQKNLAGQFNIGVTNLGLSVDKVRDPYIKILINVVATIPQLISNPETAIVSLLTRATGLSKNGLMNQLHQSPIETITVQGGAGKGQINLLSAAVQSTAFEADATGTIALAPVLTNSTINIPVTVLLSHSIAGQLNLTAAQASTAGAYVPLPRFLTLTGTLGDPKPQINNLALVGITAKSLGNSLIKSPTGAPSQVGSFLNHLLRR